MSSPHSGPASPAAPASGQTKLHSTVCAHENMPCWHWQVNAE
jgi:hypothetical protein